MESTLTASAVTGVRGVVTDSVPINPTEMGNAGRLVRRIRPSQLALRARRAVATHDTAAAAAPGAVRS